MCEVKKFKMSGEIHRRHNRIEDVWIPTNCDIENVTNIKNDVVEDANKPVSICVVKKFGKM